MGRVQPGAAASHVCRSAVAALPTHPLALAFASTWFAFACTQLDADGSGTLDIEEIFEYVRALRILQRRAVCTGALTPRSLAAYVLPQLADMDENIANELMSELDQNGDGEVDFEEFCNGWDRIFIVGSRDTEGGDAAPQQESQAADGADAAATDDDEQAAAAATVQSHFRGHQARKEVAFRKQLRDERAAERERNGDGEWDSAHMDDEGAGGFGGKGGAEGDDYTQPLYELGPEMAQLDAGRQRQAQQVAEAAALRRAQELELEAEAMAREEAYLSRMRDGLVRRGMLGSAASQRSTTQQEQQGEGGEGSEIAEDMEARALEDYEAEVDATAAAAMGKKTPSQLMPSAKQALSLDVGPLTTPTPELKADEMIRWGGPAGIRLVLQHNLRKVAENGARNRSTLL